MSANAASSDFERFVRVSERNPHVAGLVEGDRQSRRSDVVVGIALDHHLA